MAFFTGDALYLSGYMSELFLSITLPQIVLKNKGVILLVCAALIPSIYIG